MRELHNLQGMIYLQYLAISQGISADMSEDGNTLNLGPGTIVLPAYGIFNANHGTLRLGHGPVFTPNGIWIEDAAPEMTEVAKAVECQFKSALA